MQLQRKNKQMRCCRKPDLLGREALMEVQARGPILPRNSEAAEEVPLSIDHLAMVPEQAPGCEFGSVLDRLGPIPLLDPGLCVFPFHKQGSSQHPRRDQAKQED